MQRLPLSLLVLSALVGCAGPQPFGMPSPVASGGFIGPDLLLGATYATAIEPPMAQTSAGISVAVDSTGTQAAYATPDGLFVGPVGGEARRLAPWSGSTRELRWALDDTALLVVESEREAACVATEIGTTCSSSNMDDFARLVKVTVADGARTVLAEHVFGFRSFALTADAALFAGRIGLAMPAKDAADLSSIYRTALGGAAAPEVIVADRSLERFSVSPDGKRLAFVERALVGGAQVARVGTQAIVAGQPVNLGALDGSSAQGPFWNAESTAVRFVRTDNGRELPVQELPLDGEARRFAVARTVQPGNIQELSNAPDGSHLVAGGFDRAAGVHPLMRLDLDDQTLTPLAPDGTLLHWLGSAPDFLCTVGRSWGKRFYVVRPDGP